MIKLKLSKINKPLTWVILFTILAVSTLLITRAATLTRVIEPEGGILSSAIVSIDDSTASQAKAVRFGHTPPTVPIKIMPLGDSITYGGVAGAFSARYYLYNMLKSAGYNINMVGSQTTYYNTGDVWDQDNEGHPGADNTELNYYMADWVAANVPDIVLIHAGTNGGTAAEIGQMIDKIRAANPNVKIFLALIIPSLYNEHNDPVAYNASLTALGSQKTTTQSPIIMVDMYTGFNVSTDTSEGLHPNAIGDQKMATKWYQALMPVLSNL